MNITIVTGGTGSTEIQNGLHKYIDNINLNLIINGYDDGKSTGEIRHFFPKTLGISDFRKNQLLEYKLLYGNNELYKFLNHRFTSKYPKEYINKYISNVSFTSEEVELFINENIYYFFTLEESIHLNYTDFSVFNIIYCSLLHKNSNNMEPVLQVIKEKLNLRNNIYLNSSLNCRLKGITKRKEILHKEYNIVDFNDNNDKIEDVYFENNLIPIMNENTRECIMNSDIIIFSCGTQFSSLIPTYKTEGFNDAVFNSKASKYLLLNCNYDNDIINYNGDELLDKINSYLNLTNINIVISNNMNQNLIPRSRKYKYIEIIKLIKNNKHDGNVLCRNIFLEFFKHYVNKQYIFDYDYTLYDINALSTSYDNFGLLQKVYRKIIVSNNSYENIINIKNTKVYSDISNVINENKKYYVDKNLLLKEHQYTYILSSLNELNYSDKIIQKTIMSISIKPVKNRDDLMRVFKENYKFKEQNIEIIKTGKTTIEFVVIGAHKRNTFVKEGFINNKDYTYISDLDDIKYNETTDAIKLLKVNSIHETNLFIKTIIDSQKYDFCISVGGINSRMKIHGPKCLIEHNGQIILESILQKIQKYANNIYICANIKYKPYFQEFEKKRECQNVKFLYMSSLDEIQDYPKGNGETIYQLLIQENITNKLFVLWGDIIINDNFIFEEIYNLNYDCDLLIPTIYEQDPYAYLNINHENKVINFEYKRNKPTDYGYHDQCIFLFDTKILLSKLEIIKQKEYDELNLLDVVQLFDNIKYYETDYAVDSFNTIDELIIPK